MALVALTLLLALNALARPRENKVGTYGLAWALALPSALAVAALFLFVRTPPSTNALPDAESFRGVNTAGVVDPEAQAQVIAAQNPDVVTLQEVARGWLNGGSLEMLDWLAARLNMPYYVFAPAADTHWSRAI